MNIPCANGLYSNVAHYSRSSILEFVPQFQFQLQIEVASAHGEVPISHPTLFSHYHTNRCENGYELIVMSNDPFEIRYDECLILPKVDCLLLIDLTFRFNRDLA